MVLREAAATFLTQSASAILHIPAVGYMFVIPALAA
jgi:hypothetical protein